jgi:hypothetical protein
VIVNELDLAALRIEKPNKQHLDPKQTPIRRKAYASPQPLQQQLRGLVASGALNAPERETRCLLLWSNTNVMAKVVTAILQNTNQFASIHTLHGRLVDDPLTDAQKAAGTQIGRKLFLMNRRALQARYGRGEHLRVPEFLFEKWADATPVEQFAAMRCSTSAAKVAFPTAGYTTS